MIVITGLILLTAQGECQRTAMALEGIPLQAGLVIPAWEAVVVISARRFATLIDLMCSRKC